MSYRPPAWRPTEVMLMQMARRCQLCLGEIGDSAVVTQNVRGSGWFAPASPKWGDLFSVKVKVFAILSVA